MSSCLVRAQINQRLSYGKKISYFIVYLMCRLHLFIHDLVVAMQKTNKFSSILYPDESNRIFNVSLFNLKRIYKAYSE